MKYIITDENEAKVGEDYTYHRTLARDCKGNVVRAGECRIVNGKYEVYGRSYGYEIDAKPEDAEILNNLLKTHEQ